MLYTTMDAFSHCFQGDIKELQAKYNNSLYPQHRQERELKTHHRYLYLEGYESAFICIINYLRNHEESGYPEYKNFARNFLNNAKHGMDCEEKKELLQKAFLKSKVVCIYGSAGTGKTRFIEHLSDLFNNHSQIFLANTNVAVENLRRRISNTQEKNFQTITTFLKEPMPADLLFLDESSTVANKDMKELLESESFKILVLVGDIYQIEAIRFGNWFSMAKKALAEHSIIELKKPYRTDDKNLLKLWNLVREGENSISEHIAKYGYSAKIDRGLYTDDREDDEIILCLNYGGLYGVNNINNFLQVNNLESPYEWGTKIYKIGDPILFNENQKLCAAISNNCKGVIENIENREGQIIFTVEANVVLTEADVRFSSIELISASENTSKIKVSINSPTSTDNDGDSNQVPFHVAYAVSIHKAQGLEYNSVKVVIADEAEERITHNIFYTAITRARKYLKIYWSAETQQGILSRIQKKEDNRDWHLLQPKVQ